MTSEYKVIGKIGLGSFGQVYKVQRHRDGQIFAEKRISFQPSNLEQRERIVKEVNILRSLDHGNIVKYVDRYVDPTDCILYLRMEYCDGGDLAGIIQDAYDRKAPLEMDTVLRYSRQLFSALAYCHSPDIKNRVIIHRDVKPQNIFVFHGGILKLGDFGLATEKPLYAHTNTIGGTPHYMSPEMYMGWPHDTKTDIWSIGCVIFELCALKQVFLGPIEALQEQVCGGIIPVIGNTTFSCLQGSIARMLYFDSRSRPAAKDLLAETESRITRRLLDRRQRLHNSNNEVLRELRAAETDKDKLASTAEELDARENKLANDASQAQSGIRTNDTLAKKFEADQHNAAMELSRTDAQIRDLGDTVKCQAAEYKIRKQLEDTRVAPENALVRQFGERVEVYIQILEEKRETARADTGRR